MKSKILLSISITLFILFTSSSAQVRHDTSSSASLDSIIFRLMIDYISADMVALNINEIEKNSIPHFGEEHHLVIPILVNPCVYQQHNSSYDKFLPSV